MFGSNRDASYYSSSSMLYNSLLLVSAIVLWAMNVSWYPSLDGVSVYELYPIAPEKGLFMNILSKPNADDTFSAEVSLLNYCVFPSVYNELIAKSKVDILPALNRHGLVGKSATDAQGFWENIDFDSMKRSYTEYNLPYDGLVTPAGKIEPSSQYYPPICRCMNKVFETYGGRENTAQEFEDAKVGINSCLATRHVIKRQTLIGEGNGPTKGRKYISRYALLFQLCFSFVFGMFYNSIDFVADFTGKSWLNGNFKYYFGLFLSFIFLWLSPLCASSSVDPSRAIHFSTIVFLPAFALGLPVEFMWSFVAKHVDIGRQTYIHPLSFYIIMSSLYTMSLIENGVFTLSVILTYIFQSNAMSIAYAGLLFASHGKIWKESTSSRTGFILLLFLPGTMHIFSMVPTFPVNCDLNILWGLPVIFAVICYSKVLFIDHFMDDEPNTQGNKHKVTHSDHLLNIGHLLVVALVVLYYIIQLSNLQYGRSGSFNMADTGGRLTRRLNFEFAEMNITGSKMPFYDTLKKPFSDTFFLNP